MFLLLWVEGSACVALKLREKRVGWIRMWVNVCCVNAGMNMGEKKRFGRPLLHVKCQTVFVVAVIFKCNSAEGQIGSSAMRKTSSGRSNAINSSHLIKHMNYLKEAQLTTKLVITSKHSDESLKALNL